MAKDPRFTGNEDMRLPANSTGLRLENVDVFKIGESGDPLDKEYTAARWFELHSKTSVVDSACKAMVLSLELAGVSQASPAMASTLHVTFTDNHTLGRQFSAAETIYAEMVTDGEAQLDGVNTYIGNLGYVAALHGRLSVPADTKTINVGRHSVLALDLNIGAGITVPVTGQAFSFITLRDRGSVKAGVFIDAYQCTSGTNNAVDQTHTTPSNCVGYLRVFMPDNSVSGIPVYTIA